MKRIRRRLFWAWQLLTIPDKWLEMAQMGIWHAYHNNRHKVEFPEDGLELWGQFFAESSIYGGGSTQTPCTGSTTTSCSGETVTKNVYYSKNLPINPYRTTT